MQGGSWVTRASWSPQAAVELLELFPFVSKGGFFLGWSPDAAVTLTSGPQGLHASARRLRCRASRPWGCRFHVRLDEGHQIFQRILFKISDETCRVFPDRSHGT